MNVHSTVVFILETSGVFLVMLFCINRHGGVRRVERDHPQRQTVFNRRGHYRSFRRILSRIIYTINRDGRR